MGDLVQTGNAEWNPTVEARNAEEDASTEHGTADQPLETTRSIPGSGKRRESLNWNINSDQEPNLVLMNSRQ